MFTEARLRRSPRIQKARETTPAPIYFKGPPIHRPRSAKKQIKISKDNKETAQISIIPMLRATKPAQDGQQEVGQLLTRRGDGNEVDETRKIAQESLMDTEISEKDEQDPMAEIEITKNQLSSEEDTWMSQRSYSALESSEGVDKYFGSITGGDSGLDMADVFMSESNISGIQSTSAGSSTGAMNIYKTFSAMSTPLPKTVLKFTAGESPSKPPSGRVKSERIFVQSSRNHIHTSHFRNGA